jgi:hypothetical protein
VEARIGCIEVVEDGADGIAANAHLGAASREAAKRSGDANGGCH